MVQQTSLIDRTQIRDLIDADAPEIIHASVAEDNSQEPTWNPGDFRDPNHSEESDVATEHLSISESFSAQARTTADIHRNIFTLPNTTAPATTSDDQPSIPIDRNDLSRLIAYLRIPSGSMPIPSSDQAPRFCYDSDNSPLYCGCLVRLRPLTE